MKFKSPGNWESNANGVISLGLEKSISGSNFVAKEARIDTDFPTRATGL